MSIFTQLGTFLSKVWKSLTGSADTVAISITEGIQEALKNGTLASISSLVEAIIPSVGKLPDTVVSTLETEIPKILAFELSVQGLPDNPTDAQIQAFEAEILKAFGVSTNNSKLWTTLAAQVYIIIKTDVDSGAKYTFAQAVIDVEKSYQDYQADVASTTGA